MYKIRVVMGTMQIKIKPCNIAMVDFRHSADVKLPLMLLFLIKTYHRHDQYLLSKWRDSASKTQRQGEHSKRGKGVGRLPQNNRR